MSGPPPFPAHLSLRKLARTVNEIVKSYWYKMIHRGMETQREMKTEARRGYLGFST